MLILARHGTTAANQAGTLLGAQGAGLSEGGIEEARALGRWLRSHYEVASIHSSDLPRASETARIVAEELGIGSVNEDSRLAERDMGTFEGMGREQLLDERRRRGLSNASPTQDWHGVEEVEQDAEVWARFSGFASESGVLAGARTADVVVITHAGVIRSCLHQSFRIPDDRRRCFRVQTGHALIFGVEQSGLELHEMWVNDGARSRRRAS